jgi:hypothetical protein
MNLHDRIMALETFGGCVVDGRDDYGVKQYDAGFRRAKREAAEMAGEADREIERLLRAVDFRDRRLGMLQGYQSRMRDPERTLVCDILANAQLLPDPHGSRYGVMLQDPGLTIASK